MLCFFFFFKQKTAYEVRISDWSSDVCSSDLLVSAGIGLAAAVSGAFLVAPSEGYNNNTYLDPVDIITSCYGHTGNDLKQGQTFTDEQCLDQLSKDLDRKSVV